MNFFACFDPFFQSLGWALIHSLWQVALIAGLVKLLLAQIPARQAQWRYWIAMSGLFSCLLLLVLTQWWYYQPDTEATATLPLTELTNADWIKLQEQTQALADTSWLDLLNANTYWISLIWVVGFLLLSLKYVLLYFYSQHLRQRGVQPLTAEWQERFDRLVARTGITRQVICQISSRVKNPLTIGHLKPLVLVPVGFFNMLSPEQAEAVLLHELAHIRRHDYLFNLIQTTIRLIFFYHPAAHFLSNCIDNEREHACDDFALALTRDPRNFARALGHLQIHFLKHQNQMAMHIIKNERTLLNRLQRLVTPEGQITKRTPLRWLAPIILLFFSGALMAFAIAPTPDPWDQRNSQLQYFSTQNSPIANNAIASPAAEPNPEPNSEPEASPEEEPLATMAEEPFLSLAAIEAIDPAEFSVEAPALRLPETRLLMPIRRDTVPNTYSEAEEERLENEIDRLEDQLDLTEDQMEELHERIEETVEAEMELHEELMEDRQERMEERMEEAQEALEEIMEEMADRQEELHEELMEAMEETEDLSEAERKERIEQLKRQLAEVEMVREQQMKAQTQSLYQAEESMRAEEKVMLERSEQMRVQSQESRRAIEEQARALEEKMYALHKEMEEKHQQMAKLQERRAHEMERFSEELKAELTSDGLINSSTKRIKLEVEAGVISINDETLPRNLVPKYKEMLERYGMSSSKGSHNRIEITND